MTTSTPIEGRTVELAIGGMTCASCAARIEKKLNRMDGVTATVNYSTEKAKVSFGDGVSVEDLVATVEATGYTAAAPQPRAAARQRADAGRRRAGRRGPAAAASADQPGADRAGHRLVDGPRRCSSTTGSGSR